MAYNYAKEKRKFDAEWKRKASWYRKEGMSEDDIEEMRRFGLGRISFAKRKRDMVCRSLVE